MKNWKLFFIFTVVVAWIPGVCLAGSDSVKIGVLMPLTGMHASYGENCVPGMKFAVATVNEQGGIKSLGGAQLELLISDTRSDPKVAGAELDRILGGKKVCALIGPFSSTEAKAFNLLSDQYKIPFISPSWTTPKAFELGSKFSRTVNFMGDVSGKYTVKLLDWLVSKWGVKAERIGLLYVDNEYGKDSASAARAELKRLGYKVAIDLPMNWKSGDFTPYLLKLKDANADVVIQISYYKDALLSCKNRFALGYRPLWIGAGSPFSDDKLWGGLGSEQAQSILGGALFGMIPTHIGVAYKPLQEMAAKAKANGITLGAKGYDVNWFALGVQTVYCLKVAMEQARSSEPEKINDALRSLVLPKGSPYLVLPFYDPSLKFADTGRPLNNALTFIQWENGKKYCVFPEEYAQRKPRIK